MIAKLRKTTFTSLPDLAAAIGDRIEAYNTEPFQKRPGSRMSVFVAGEQPLLKPLPQVAYEISHWVYGRSVAHDGHVVGARNHFSVPFVRVGGKVDLRITDRVLEAYRGPEPLTSHLLPPEGSAGLLDAFTAQDQALVLGMGFSERIALVVDEAHQAFTHSKVDGLTRRAGLRYPKADLRRLDLVEERGLDRSLIGQLGTCTFIERQQNVVFHGFTGSGKS